MRNLEFPRSTSEKSAFERTEESADKIKKKQEVLINRDHTQANKENNALIERQKISEAARTEADSDAKKVRYAKDFIQAGDSREDIDIYRTDYKRLNEVKKSLQDAMRSTQFAEDSYHGELQTKLKTLLDEVVSKMESMVDGARDEATGDNTRLDEYVDESVASEARARREENITDLDRAYMQIDDSKDTAKSLRAFAKRRVQKKEVEESEKVA